LLHCLFCFFCITLCFFGFDLIQLFLF
jgi:hypothetical protein